MSENEADEECDDVWNVEDGLYESMAPDMFRTVPIDKMIEPLLEVFGRALGTMPELEEAELFTWLRWAPSEEREFDYPDPPLHPRNKKHRWG